MDGPSRSLDTDDDDSVRRRLVALRDGLERDCADPRAFGLDELAVRAASVANELAILPIDGLERERLRCLIEVARAFLMSGRPQLALPPSEDARVLALSLEDEYLYRRALTLSGIALGDQGFFVPALERTVEAFQIARSTEDIRGILGSLTNLASVAASCERFDDGLALANYGLDVVEQERAKGDASPIAGLLPGIEGGLLINAGSILWRMSRSEVALPMLQRWSDARDNTSQYFNHPSNRSYGDFVLGVVAVELGRFEQAAAQVAVLTNMAADNGADRDRACALALEGLLRVKQGDDGGFALLEQARDLGRRVPQIYTDMVALLIRAYESGLRPYRVEPVRDLLSVTRRLRQATVSAMRKLALRSGGSTDVYGLLARIAVTSSLAEDPSGEHHFRVARLAGLVAQALGRGPREVEVIAKAALLHDIGKCTIPAQILRQPGSLGDEGWAILKSHAASGSELIALADLDDGGVAQDVARHHHEHVDGTGFPDGLAGSSIPLGARIVAACNAFDGLIKPRHGLPGVSPLDALEESKRDSGRRFDASVVEALGRVMQKLPRSLAELDAELLVGARESEAMAAVQMIRQIAQGH